MSAASAAKALALKLKDTSYDQIEDSVRSLIRIAEENNLLIVYGSSDDLIEFRGMWTDEHRCGHGTVVRFDHKGIIPSTETFVDDLNSRVGRAGVDNDSLLKDMKEYCERVQSGHYLKVSMVDGSNGKFFVYNTNLPQELFIVHNTETSSVYCVGMVIQLKPSYSNWIDDRGGGSGTH